MINDSERSDAPALGAGRELWWSFDAFRAALGFLTIVPIGGRPSCAQPLNRTLQFFPLVGLLIGVLSAVAGGAAAWLFGEPLHALFAVMAWTFLTAGFHLDGLADSADALLSWREREKKLRIMKDPHLGVMGALALLFVILTKIMALLAAGEHWWQAVLLAPVLGRLFLVYSSTNYPPAREEGLACEIRRQVPDAALPAALLIAAALSLLIGGAGGLLALIACWLAARVLAAKALRELGGLTGDIDGMICELVETAALLCLLAVWQG